MMGSCDESRGIRQLRLFRCGGLWSFFETECIMLPDCSALGCMHCGVLQPFMTHEAHEDQKVTSGPFLCIHH